MRRGLFRYNRLTVFCLLVLIVLSFPGCKAIFWRTYQDNDHKFLIRIPRSWQARHDVEGATLMLRAPLEGKKDKFRENVTITVKELPDYLFQDPHFRSNPSGIFFEAKKEKLLDFFSVDEMDSRQEQIRSGRYRGESIIFDVKLEDISFKMFVALWIANKREYTLVFTAESEKYPKYKNILENIVDSFTIK